MSIDWLDSYKIGDSEIDRQHQELFELTNQVIATDDIAALKPLIMKLYHHTREHFELEEGLMRKVEYPQRSNHIQYHNRLLDRLNQISLGIGQGHADKPALEKLMSDWALRHIREDDARIATYVAAR